MVKALHLGLWFISGNFLSVRKWEPKFVPQEATLTSTTIWIWLPQLPTEFYDQDILEKVGRKLGKLLKIDQCTSSTLRGRYARICIQVPLETPVETSIIIGDHKQVVIYEGEGTLCTICGRIGHTAHICNYRAPTPTATHEPQDDHQRKAVISEKSEWKTVTFPRRRKQGQLKTINTNEGKMNKPQHASRTEEIQSLNFTPLVTQSSKTKKHKNGKRDTTDYHHHPTTTTGPATGLLVGGCLVGGGTLLRFHPVQPEGDTDSAKPSQSSQGDDGSTEQGTGSLWTSSMEIDGQQR
ncbi:uncharacterized protein [Nicotiana sylvestris]|uniref:uncharacterized protein n=1 Tax=Nicotiana sylvestris TaxID=4096 RepID=UPI00388CB873